MKWYACNKCQRGECPRRKSNKKNGPILELAETIMHEDGSRERRVWGKVNWVTNEIISAKFI